MLKNINSPLILSSHIISILLYLLFTLNLWIFIALFNCSFITLIFIIFYIYTYFFLKVSKSKYDLLAYANMTNSTKIRIKSGCELSGNLLKYTHAVWLLEYSVECSRE